MYRIGEFSVLSKTTIKALRYYEKEGLLVPTKVEFNGYRYYDAKELITVAKIKSLRQLDISISDIKNILNGNQNINEVLKRKKEEIENNLNEYKYQLSKINYLLEEKNMNNEIFMKELPDYTVYYKEGVLKDYSECLDFVLKSGEECLKLNPNIKCVSPDYCFMTYLDKEHKENNIKVRYSQAVIPSNFVSDENIKFMKLKPVTAVCIYHKGSYSLLSSSYGALLKYIEDNDYEIIECPRECYIDGMWNKEDVNDYLTEIQFPIRKKK